jgi:hypothetical protein
VGQNELKRAVLSRASGITFDDPGHSWLATVMGPGVCKAVKLRESRSQRRHQFEIQPPRLRQTLLEPRLLREAIQSSPSAEGGRHFDQVGDRLGLDCEDAEFSLRHRLCGRFVSRLAQHTHTFEDASRRATHVAVSNDSNSLVSWFTVSAGRPQPLRQPSSRARPPCADRRKD